MTDPPYTYDVPDEYSPTQWVTILEERAVWYGAMADACRETGDYYGDLAYARRLVELKEIYDGIMAERGIVA